MQKNFFKGLATVLFYFFVKETVRQRRMKKMQSIFFGGLGVSPNKQKEGEIAERISPSIAC